MNEKTFSPRPGHNVLHRPTWPFCTFSFLARDVLTAALTREIERQSEE